jgi:hypothetical protein
VTRRYAFEPAARETYLALRKDADNALYLAVKAVLVELLENPGTRHLRQLRYRPDTWAVPVRCGDVRWLVVWRPADADPELIEVHYVGPAPGEQ